MVYAVAGAGVGVGVAGVGEVSMQPADTAAQRRHPRGRRLMGLFTVIERPPMMKHFGRGSI
jgi:hypothetical protein